MIVRNQNLELTQRSTEKSQRFTELVKLKKKLLQVPLGGFRGKGH